MFQKEITKAANSYLEQARSLFRKGLETGDLIIALQNLSSIVPSKAKYFDQHGFMEGALDCNASTNADQKDCNRFVSVGVTDVREIVIQAHVITEPQLKLLASPKEG